MKKIKKFSLFFLLSFFAIISCNNNDEIILDNQKTTTIVKNQNLKSRRAVIDTLATDRLVLEINEEYVCLPFGESQGNRDTYIYSLSLYVHPRAEREYPRLVNVWAFWNNNTNSLPSNYSFRIPANFTGPLKIDNLIPENTSISFQSLKVQIQNVLKIEGNSYFRDNSSEWVDDLKTEMMTCIEINDLPCNLNPFCDDEEDDTLGE